MKNVIVCGAGGFIGAHLVKWLRRDGCAVRGVDLVPPEFAESAADEFIIADLRDAAACMDVFDREFDEVYQLAADMGGAGYVFTGENDAAIMHNSVAINLNVLDACRRSHAGRIFYSSSACMYPEYNQIDAANPVTREDSAYPANPDSEYGWEKLFSERLYLAYSRNYGLKTRVARYHNVFGPEGTWSGGKEKAPAAICRKVAETPPHGAIEIWGDGEQTRSFLYIDECVEATVRLMRSQFEGPVNVGSQQSVTINDLARLTMRIAGKPLGIRHVPGPLGVRGRSSDNDLIRKALGWAPSMTLADGLARTYPWIEQQVTTASRAIA